MNYEGNLYLTDRIAAVNRADYGFVAEIHLNAGGGTGTECFYYNGSPTGLKASKAITNEISKEFSVRNRGAKVKLNENGKDYFAIIRDTRPTAILVETVFIDNADDVRLVSTADGQKRCGEAIGRALESALGAVRVQKNTFSVKINANSLYIRSGAGTGNQALGIVKTAKFTKSLKQMQREAGESLPTAEAGFRLTQNISGGFNGNGRNLFVSRLGTRLHCGNSYLAEAHELSHSAA